MPKHAYPRLRLSYRTAAVVAALATLAGLLVTFVTGGPASAVSGRA